MSFNSTAEIKFAWFISAIRLLCVRRTRRRRAFFASRAYPDTDKTRGRRAICSPHWIKQRRRHQARARFIVVIMPAGRRTNGPGVWWNMTSVVTLFLQLAPRCHANGQVLFCAGANQSCIPHTQRRAPHLWESTVCVCVYGTAHSHNGYTRALSMHTHTQNIKGCAGALLSLPSSSLRCEFFRRWWILERAHPIVAYCIIALRRLSTVKRGNLVGGGARVLPLEATCTRED